MTFPCESQRGFKRFGYWIVGVWSEHLVVLYTTQHDYAVLLMHERMNDENSSPFLEIFGFILLLTRL
jgi:uncharacterized protein YktB (UPF0637 family)